MGLPGVTVAALPATGCAGALPAIARRALSVSLIDQILDRARYYSARSKSVNALFGRGELGADLVAWRSNQSAELQRLLRLKAMAWST